MEELMWMCILNQTDCISVESVLEITAQQTNPNSIVALILAKMDGETVSYMVWGSL